MAEFEGDESLRREATDLLVLGLEALGFQVLAPRRSAAPPPGRRPEPLDWVFAGEIHTKTHGGLDLKVDLQSLREGRRVWSITDTRPHKAVDEFQNILARTVATALEKFELDVLKCQHDRRNSGSG